MKRTYSRLSSELLRFDTESGFMSCSVRVASDVMVEDWHDFNDWVEDAASGSKKVEGGFSIGFDE